MNVERLLMLAEILEGKQEMPPIHGKPMVFDMSAWPYFSSYQNPQCCTACCIGGHTNLLWPPKPGEDDADAAQRALGLDEDTAQQLFFPDSYRYGAAEAAAVLRELVRTGKVNWPECRGGAEE